MTHADAPPVSSAAFPCCGLMTVITHTSDSDNTKARL